MVIPTSLLAAGLTFAVLNSNLASKANVSSQTGYESQVSSNRERFTHQQAESKYAHPVVESSREVRSKPALMRPIQQTQTSEGQAIDPDAILQQCLHQMVHGPSTEAQVEVIVKQPELDAITLGGRFANLGQASGLSKTGFQLAPATDEKPAIWVWQISRGKTSLRIGPLLGNSRQVLQQPSWLNSNSDQFQLQENCYGSPISLLQWGSQHFYFTAEANADSSVIQLVGQLRPNVAQSWGDGTKLSDAQKAQRQTDASWLADHVLFPLPHEIQLQFSNQRNTARTLLSFQILRYEHEKKTGNLNKAPTISAKWTQWSQVDHLSPADFPLQLETDQSAVKTTPGNVRR